MSLGISVLIILLKLISGEQVIINCSTGTVGDGVNDGSFDNFLKLFNWINVEMPSSLDIIIETSPNCWANISRNDFLISDAMIRIRSNTAEPGELKFIGGGQLNFFSSKISFENIKLHFEHSTNSSAIIANNSQVIFLNVAFIYSATSKGELSKPININYSTVEIYNISLEEDFKNVEVQALITFASFYNCHNILIRVFNITGKSFRGLACILYFEASKVHLEELNITGCSFSGSGSSTISFLIANKAAQILNIKTLLVQNSNFYSFGLLENDCRCTEIILSEITVFGNTIPAVAMFSSPGEEGCFIRIFNILIADNLAAGELFKFGANLDLNIANFSATFNRAKNVLYFEKAGTIQMSNFLCQENNFNATSNSRYNEGSECIKLLNQRSAFLIRDSAFKNCFSQTSSACFSIIETADAETKKIEILIESCIFYNNQAHYFTSLTTGCAIFTDARHDITLVHTSFFKNSINSTFNVSEKQGGPCLNSVHLNNSVTIKDCWFEKNSAFFTTNCISFYGRNLLIASSLFVANVPIILEETYTQYINDIKDDTYMEPRRILEYSDRVYGGALYSKGEEVVIEKCGYFLNEANTGGAINFAKSILGNQNRVLIRNTSFVENRAGPSSSFIHFFNDLLNLEALLIYCEFIGNDAKFGGIGVTWIATNMSIINLIVHSSNFTRNTGGYGAGINCEHIGGTITIMSCNFIENVIPPTSKEIPGAGSGAAIKITTDRKANFTSINNCFIGNDQANGGTVVIFGGKLWEFGSFYLGNRAGKAASISVIQMGIVFIVGSHHENEYAGTYCGSVGGREFSYLEIRYATFKGCSSSKGGVITIMEHATAFIFNCSFIQNEGSEGAVAYVLENYFETVVYFENCHFSENRADDSVFSVITASIGLKACSFYKNVNLIFLLENSLITLQQAIIEEHRCTNIRSTGCILNALLNSQAFFYDSLFSSFYAEISSQSGMINLYSSFTMTIKNSNFSNLTTVEFGGVLSGLDGALMIENTIFLDIRPNCLILEDLKLFINNSSFFRSNYTLQDIAKKYSGSTISLNSPRNSILISVNFLHIETDDDGSCLKLERINKNASQSQILVSYSNFEKSMTSGKGGAIFIDGIGLSIIKSVFKSNKARFGGAIYYQARVDSEDILNLSDCQFFRNSASAEGGAIKFTEKLPIIFGEDNIFNLNSAPYGPDWASYAVKYSFELTALGDGKAKDIFKIEGTRFIFNSSSGQKINFKMRVNILDTHDQIVSSDNSSEFIVRLYGKREMDHDHDLKLLLGNYTDWLSEKSYFVSGDLLRIALNGSVEFDNWIITGEPSKYYLLKVINQHILELSDSLPNNSEIVIQQSLNFIFRLRDCISGEIYNYFENTVSCLKCPRGKYSLSEGEQSCRICPSGADCLGGNSISLYQGFWRASNTSSFVFDCGKHYSHCLGGSESTCEKGYKGPLCSSCVYTEGLSFMKADEVCTVCDSYWIIVLKLCSMGFVLLVLLIFLIWNYLQSSKQHKAFSYSIESLTKMTKSVDKSVKNTFFESNIQQMHSVAINLKIFLNYLQMISIINQFELRWPYKVKDIITMQSYINPISSQITTVDCLIKIIQPDSHVLYIRAAMSAMFPFFAIMLNHLYFIFNNARRRDHDLREKLLLTTSVLIFFFQPQVIRFLAVSVNCADFNGQSRVYEDLEVSCETKEHQAWANYLIIPMIFLWSLVIPSVYLGILLRNRRNLDDKGVKGRLGFFYIGYSPRKFYWEFVIIYRKILLSFFTFFFQSKLQTRGLLVFYLISIACWLHYYANPYFSAFYNVLEMRSLIVSLITVFMGLFFVQDFSDLAQSAMFISIIVVNLHFFLMWLTSTLKIAIETVLDSYDFAVKLAPLMKPIIGFISVYENLRICFWKPKQMIEVYQKETKIFEDFVSGKKFKRNLSKNKKLESKFDIQSGKFNSFF